MFDHVRLNLYCHVRLLAVRTNPFSAYECKGLILEYLTRQSGNFDDHSGELWECHVEDLVCNLLNQSGDEWYVRIWSIFLLEKHLGLEYTERWERPDDVLFGD